jgi:hypothetical protein
MVNGATLAMSADVLPVDATDPSVVWSVATLAAGTATINITTGVLTATGVGTVTVTATAHDGSGVTGTKVITIAMAPSSEKAIIGFSFQGLVPAVDGTVDEDAKTIALTVPFGTVVTALVATFTNSAASAVTVGGTAQISGTTANNFTSPVAYLVTAQDGTTVTYTVTVTVAPALLAVGDSYGGGKVAYILANGDTGYDPNIQHGLIAALAGASETIAWSNITDTLVGTTGVAIGTGQANTTAIVGQVVGETACTSGAAYYCDRLVEGGYSDWFLPSRDELRTLCVHQVAIGGFGGGSYWSSSEGCVSDACSSAWATMFCYDCMCMPYGTWKYSSQQVRAVRAF